MYYSRNGEPRADLVSPKLIGLDKNATFWITWSNGLLTVGIGPIGGQKPIMTYTDPAPTPINYLAFSGIRPAFSATWTVPQLSNPPSNFSVLSIDTRRFSTQHLSTNCTERARSVRLKLSANQTNYIDAFFNQDYFQI